MSTDRGETVFGSYSYWRERIGEEIATKLMKRAEDFEATGDSARDLVTHLTYLEAASIARGTR